MFEWGRGCVRTFKRTLGEWYHVARFLPGVSVYRLAGPDWTVAYVGDDVFIHHLLHVLFSTGVVPERICDVSLWAIPKIAKRLLSDFDLVVCSLPRRCPQSWRPSANWSFTCPVWVDQVVNIEQPLEVQIGGADRRDFRSRLRRAQRVGFVKRVTRDKDEFKNWYLNLHLPLIQRKFGELADVDLDYETYWKRWVADNGELLLIEYENKTIAGAVVRYDGDTCVIGKIGFLPDPAAKETERAQLSAWAFAIERARDKGMKKAVMGWSLARYGNPVMRAKREWGATIVPTGVTGHSEWTFLLEKRNEKLWSHLNDLRLISFICGESLVVQLAGEMDNVPTEYYGVDGVLLVGLGHNTRLSHTNKVGDKFGQSGIS